MIIMWSYNYYYYYVLILVLLLMIRVNSSSFSSSSFTTSAPSSYNPISACSALLQFKASLSLDSYDPWTWSDYKCDDWSPKIRSWSESSNCCGWEGVTCDTDHKVIIGLDLSCSSLSASLSLANITLLLPKTLQRLNLAFNHFNDSIPSQLFTHLVSLTHLNLSYNDFYGSIPSEISLLTQLLSLDLSSNGRLIFDNRYSAFDMFAHSNSSSKLRNLFLDDVYMPGVPPSSLLNFTSLRHLSLCGCGLEGELPSEVFRFPDIQYLDLSSNYFSTGYLSAESNWSSPIKYLDLSYCDFRGPLPASLGNLTRLTFLDLANNVNFGGEIPNVFGSLRQLGELRLGSSNFSGQLPSTIFNLTRITYLDLSENSLEGGFPAAHVSGLRSLKKLDLSFNLISGELPSWLFALPSLQYLDLRSNNLICPIPNFSGQLPSTIFNLTRITYLDLSNNSLQGGFPHVISGLQSLEQLDLSSNLISGGLPSWLFALPSLHSLYLYNNKLSGPIPSFSLDPVNLTRLDLSSNNLGGVITSEMLSRPKRLEYLDLSYNSLLSLSDSDHGNDVNYTIPELSFISFSSCNISRFPYFLRVANKLSSLNLSHNKIQGSISEWGSKGWEELSLLNLSYNLLTSFSLDQFPGMNLFTLDLHSNQLQVPLLPPPPSILELDISENKLTGEILPCFCNLSSKLLTLDLSRNNLSGIIPPCFSSFSWIRTLDLSRNKLSGIIPPYLANSSVWVRTINLQMNNFYGQIPAFEDSESLQHLLLNDNQLEGRVPRSLVNCTSLVYLNLANNYLNDTFPHWLDTLPLLQYLFLGSNRFHGRLSNSTFSKLQIIDLSQNEFIGPLPTEFFQNLSAFKGASPTEYCSMYESCGTLYSYGNVKVTMKRLQIEIEEGRILPSFTLLDFSNNQFHGEIPDVVGELVSLHVLNLSHNYLTGPIPPSLGNIQALESFDLSSNKLSGRIPLELTNLNFLEVFNLSQNNFEGPIPTGKQFNTFDNDSYGGNPRLCDFPLTKKCENIPEPPPSSSADDDDEDSGIPFIWKVVMMGYGCGLVLGVSMGYIVFTTGRPWWIVRKVERDWQNNVTKWFRRFGIGGGGRRRS